MSCLFTPTNHESEKREKKIKKYGSVENWLEYKKRKQQLLATMNIPINTSQEDELICTERIICGKTVEFWIYVICCTWPFIFVIAIFFIFKNT